MGILLFYKGFTTVPFLLASPPLVSEKSYLVCDWHKEQSELLYFNQCLFYLLNIIYTV